MGALFATLAGLCSGTWPFFMRQTGLSIQFVPAAFCLGAAAVTVPFALAWTWYFQTGLPREINWRMFAATAGFGGGVLVFLAAMLAQSTSQTVGINLVILAVVQIAVPAVYTVVAGGELPSPRLLGGLAASFLAVFLLVGAR